MRTFQILALLMLFFTVSCSTSSIEEFVVGENFVKDQTGVVMVDTLTIQSSTVKVDSIPSNSVGRILAGTNYNSFSGYKTANSFLTMKFDDAIDNTEFVYDSLCLVLNYDTYYFGDTTINQTIGIHRILEKLELNSTTNYLYTTSNFKYDTTPLGSITFQPCPKSKKEVSIRLSDTFGNRLSQMIKAKKDTITSQDLFQKFFYGIVIKAQPNVKSAIVGFRTTDASSASESDASKKKNVKTKPEFRLYYHLSPNPTDLHDLYYKFSFVSDGVYFTQISGNSSNSLIDGIENSNNEKDSKLTNNNIIIQSGIQTYAKLRVPYIDNLLKIGKNSALVGATLRLYPIKGTYINANNLPDSLYLYSADRRNKLISQMTLPGSTKDYAFARLRIPKDVDEKIYYEMDISSFIDTELKEQLETNLSLMIGFGSTAVKKNVGHVVLGGRNSGKYAPMMNIYYYHN